MSELQQTTHVHTPDAAPTRGGVAAAIRHHYDASNSFYRLWLDETMTYSCALWEPGIQRSDLAGAQRAKLDYHLANAAIGRAKHLLDIGCGWGSLMKRALRNSHVTRATGLTLSDAQFDQLSHEQDARIAVVKESWIDHRPTHAYDSIVSIGAFEHFAHPGQSSQQKVELYREFFERCRSWMSASGRMSLQTIAYGTLRPHEASDFINTEIFPDAELPITAEVIQAIDGVFELTSLRNDREHYGLTCDMWLSGLRSKRAEAIDLVGEEQVVRYEKYLRMSAFGFYSGKIALLRLALRPIAAKSTGSAKAGVGGAA